MRLLLLILASFLFAHLPLSLPAFAAEDEVAIKKEFLLKLEKEAEEKLAKVEATLSKEEKVKVRAVMKRGLAVAADKIFALKGPLLRNSFLVASITPFTFVLDQAVIAALWATGNWQLALLYKTMPGTVTMNATAVAIAESRDTYRLARDLGLLGKPQQFFSLMREKKRALDTLKNSGHVLTAMLKAQEDEATRLKIRVGKPAPYASMAQISKGELEKIIQESGPEGSKFLTEVSGEMHNRPAYSLLLLEKIQSEEAMNKKLLERMIPPQVNPDPKAKAIQEALFEIQDHRSRLVSLATEISDQQDRIGVTTMSNFKDTALRRSLEEKKILYQMLLRLNNEVDELQRELRRLEYGTLYEKTYGPLSEKAGRFQDLGKLKESLLEREAKAIRMKEALKGVDGAAIGNRLASLLNLEKQLYGVETSVQLKAQKMPFDPSFGAVSCSEDFARF